MPTRANKPRSSYPTAEERAAFGERLARAMAHADHTNATLGRACGVGENVVSNWRRGESTPQGRVPWLLCLALGVDLWLPLWGDVRSETIPGGRLYSEVEVNERARQMAADLLAEQTRQLRSPTRTPPSVRRPS